jgi:hypothetical protein
MRPIYASMVVPAEKFAGADNCIADAVRWFKRRYPRCPSWSVSAEWGDADRETILITYREAMS